MVKVHYYLKCRDTETFDDDGGAASDDGTGDAGTTDGKHFLHS